MRSVHVLLVALALGCSSESPPPVRDSLLPPGGGSATVVAADASFIDATQLDATAPLGDGALGDGATGDGARSDTGVALQTCPNGAMCPIDFICCQVSCVQAPGPCP